jgi:lysophospholipase L1-like esterase
MRSIRKKHIVWSIILVVITIVTGEVFARYYLGLGSPPLSVEHPQIEYMFKPNQDVYRFGNHIIINQYGMRTIPFDSDKSYDEFRIMIFGDSVINGGNQTDHFDLATTILQQKLYETKRKAVVGNISAGSWGPGNWLAYAKEYGFFGADVVVLVISSHDYADNPTFQALNKNTHPTENPMSAILEGIARYLPRYLPQINTGGESIEPVNSEEYASEQKALEGLEDLRDFLELAKSNTANVMVLQNWEKKEIERGYAKSGNLRIKEVCNSTGVTTISLEPYFRRSLDSGSNPYRDNIHPNQVGQQLIARVILEKISK